MRRQISLREISAGDGTCLRCGATVPVEDLDRHLWCSECVAGAQRRSRARGRIAGMVVAAGAILYIAAVVKPDLSLIPMVWAAIVVAAYYFGAKIGTEVAFAVERSQGGKVAEAVAKAAAGDARNDPPRDGHSIGSGDAGVD